VAERTKATVLKTVSYSGVEFCAAATASSRELPVRSQGRKVAGHGPVPIVGEVGEDVDRRHIGGTLRSA
jgi:hypothetical protein